MILSQGCVAEHGGSFGFIFPLEKLLLIVCFGFFAFK